MSHGKQFTLFTHNVAPSGWKVAVVLEELGLTYDPVYLDFQKGEQRASPYAKYNPSGRIPALIDHHNNDFVIWETTAIIVYLVENYDPGHEISASTESDKFLQLQYLCFQSSEQVPYSGQFVWFAIFHSEKIPSVIERFKQEALRIVGVLDGILSKQEWLICGKPTIADLSFVVMTRLIFDLLIKDEEPVNVRGEYPAVSAWLAKLEARDAVQKIIDMKAKVSIAV